MDFGQLIYSLILRISIADTAQSKDADVDTQAMHQFPVCAGLGNQDITVFYLQFQSLRQSEIKINHLPITTFHIPY